MCIYACIYINTSIYTHIHNTQVENLNLAINSAKSIGCYVVNIGAQVCTFPLDTFCSFHDFARIFAKPNCCCTRLPRVSKQNYWCTFLGISILFLVERETERNKKKKREKRKRKNRKIERERETSRLHRRTGLSRIKFQTIHCSFYNLARISAKQIRPWRAILPRISTFRERERQG